jgi:4-amino-4-deoxy-L-arabinose transferase-like glycosyltransferase
MPETTRHCVLLILLLAVALAMRLTAATWWQTRLPAHVQFGFPDSESYWELGRQIGRGDPYQFGSDDARVFRAPGYPLVLAGMFVLFGDRPHVLWARSMSAVLGTLAVGGVYWLSRLLFDRSTGLPAAAIVTIYPGAIAMSVFVLSEALFCPLMLAHLILWIAAWRAKKSTAVFLLAGLAGVVAGAAVLTRPSWLLFTPVALGAVVVCYSARWRQLQIGLVMIAALAATMTPWWIRNYVVVGHFVPTTLQVGASLYDGLNPRATGASDMRFADADVARPPGPHEIAAGWNAEYERDRRYRLAATEWARKHPGRVLQLAGIKFVRMWNIWPNEQKFSSWRMRLLVAAGYVPVMILALVGIWWFGRRGWPYAMCLMPALYFTALHVVFVSSIRYRQPAMLTLIVLAAGAAVAMGRGQLGGGRGWGVYTFFARNSRT